MFLRWFILLLVDVEERMKSEAIIEHMQSDTNTKQTNKKKKELYRQNNKGNKLYEMAPMFWQMLIVIIIFSCLQNKWIIVSSLFFFCCDHEERKKNAEKLSQYQWEHSNLGSLTVFRHFDSFIKLPTNMRMVLLITCILCKVFISMSLAVGLFLIRHHDYEQWPELINRTNVTF